MTHALSLTERWQRFWYLQSVEIWLEPMSGRRRREVLRELKANLGEAAADSGMQRAVADLGRPRSLAAGYLEAEPAGRPHWTLGAVAAGLVLAGWLYATLFYTIGMLDALSSAGATAAANGSFLGTRVRALYTEQEISAGFAGWPWPPLLTAVLVFLLASRAWKALPRRSAGQVPAAG